MPKLRQKYKKPLGELNQAANVLQKNKTGSNSAESDSHSKPTVEDIGRVSSLFDDENRKPSSPGTSTSALYDELDSFRQRWKRELQVITESQSVNVINTNRDKNTLDGRGGDDGLKGSEPCDKIVVVKDDKDASKSNGELDEKCDRIYAEAKKLFLVAVDLEKNDMHYESIRYYRQAMHLYPDIEKQIFREQCEASAKANTDAFSSDHDALKQDSTKLDIQEQSNIKLYDRICEKFYEDNANQAYSHCKPTNRVKAGTIHISSLPHELMLHIFRFVVGDELDLASLEQAGMVCRGFYIISHESSLWRSICFKTWGPKTLDTSFKAGDSKATDWRQMFLDRPRVNYDGVYISRTRYIRQGDVGFQDITYRPFHVVRYYRYLRFFPDHRVLILTTNEEPDKIVPIFRHALTAKQFSPELSVLQGYYEFLTSTQIKIVAEKDCRVSHTSNQNHRRQAQLQWSRQTPITQKFNLEFKLKTLESKPHRNNVLKWLDYTILTRLESGSEITTFDLSQETFPSLTFSRVKRFNLRSSNPLSSQ